MSTKTLVLHPLDQIASRGYMRCLFCFPLLDENINQSLEALQASVDMTISQSPFLSGTLQIESQETGRLRLTFPSEGARKQLKVKRFPDFGCSYEELRRLGMPMKFFGLELGPFPTFRPDLSEPVEVFGVQANLIPGGLVLATYVHHSIADGIGYSIVTTQLARNCFFSSERNSGGELQKTQNSYGNVEFSQVPWQGDQSDNNPLISGIPGYTVYENLSPIPMTAIPTPVITKLVRTFVFHKSSIAKLKSLLVAHLPKETPSENAWISTYDSIVALFWSAITVARLKSGASAPLSLSSPSSPITSQLMYPTTLRKILQLPKSYCHNACLSTTTPPIPVHDFTLEDTEFLSKLALTIRETTAAITEPRSRQVISLINSLSDVRTLQRPAGADIGLSGQYDLMFTNCAPFPWYDLDFGGGLGKVDWAKICPLNPLGWDGLGYVMPERKEPGVEAGKAEIEVVLGLKTEAMEALCKDESLMKWVDRII